jgi:hypothetical protein
MRSCTERQCLWGRVFLPIISCAGVFFKAMV